MEHSTHHCSHAIKGGVGGGKHDAKGLYEIPHSSKDKACDSPEEDGGRKRTTATASPRGGCGSKDFHQSHEREEDEQILVVSIEERIVHHRRGIAHSVTIEQGRNRGIAFTIERWEEEDEGCQY